MTLLLVIYQSSHLQIANETDFESKTKQVLHT